MYLQTQLSNEPEEPKRRIERLIINNIGKPRSILLLFQRSLTTGLNNTKIVKTKVLKFDKLTYFLCTYFSYKLNYTSLLHHLDITIHRLTPIRQRNEAVVFAECAKF